MPSTPYTVRLEDNVRQALEQEAKLEDRPAAQLAARAIKSMLDAKAAKRSAIDAALIEAERGEFISSEAMGRWVQSWGTEEQRNIPKPDVFDT